MPCKITNQSIEGPATVLLNPPAFLPPGGIATWASYTAAQAVTALGGAASVVEGLTIEDAPGAGNSGLTTIPVGAGSGDFATYQQLADGALRTDLASAVHGKGASLSTIENPHGLLAAAEANVESFAEGFVEQVIVVSKTGIDSGQVLVPDVAVPTPKKLWLEECRVLNGTTGWSGNSFSKITLQDGNGVAFLDVPIANLGGSGAIVTTGASGNVQHAAMVNGGTAAKGLRVVGDHAPSAGDDLRLFIKCRITAGV